MRLKGGVSAEEIVGFGEGRCGCVDGALGVVEGDLEDFAVVGGEIGGRLCGRAVAPGAYGVEVGE